jgi:hypothetical protein
MVSRVSGTGPVPQPDRTAQVAAKFKAELNAYVNACATLNPDNSLADFANKTAALAKAAQEAQTC